MAVDARILSRLPVATDRWEVDIMTPEPGPNVRPSEEWLLVVDAASGQLRAELQLFEARSLRDALGEAMAEPGDEAAPARPRLLRCATEEVRRRVAAACPVGKVVIKVGPVDALDALLDERDEVDDEEPEPDAVLPGVTAEFELWRAAVELFIAHAPWQVVSDRVVFRFDDAPLDLAEVVVVVIPPSRGGPALWLFEDLEMYHQLIDHEGAYPGCGPDVMVLIPRGECSTHEILDCAKAGLLFGAEWALSVFHAHGDAERELNLASASRLLAAVQAVSVHCAGHRGRLARQPCASEVPTACGSMRVTSTPPGMDGERSVESAWDGLVEAASRESFDGSAARVVGSADGAPVLELTLRAPPSAVEEIVGGLREARQLGALAVGDVISFAVGRGIGWTKLVALPAAGLKLGDGWETKDAAIVVVKDDADPARREVVATCAVGRVDLDPDGVFFCLEPSVDPEFLGPVSRWTKGSRTLLAFVEPCAPLAMLELADYETTLNLGAKVWNAVVHADFERRHERLELLVHLFWNTPSWLLLGSLVAAKRARHLGDPRLFQLVEVTSTGNRRDVSVQTSWPEGLASAPDVR